MLTRRTLLRTSGLAIAGLVAAPALGARPVMRVYRDPNCGCCGKWIDLARASGRYDVRVVETADVIAVKRRLAIPEDLWSCHTTILPGFAVEGHVPLPAIERLLRERPAGVRGLAVAGMPAGSPGMEVPGRFDGFYVVAFGVRRHIFARYERPS